MILLPPMCPWQVTGESDGIKAGFLSSKATPAPAPQVGRHSGCVLGAVLVDLLPILLPKITPP